MKHLKINMMIAILLCCSMAGVLAKGNAKILIHIENQDARKVPMRLFLQDEYIYEMLGSYEVKAESYVNGKYSFLIRNFDAYKRIRLEYNNVPFLYSYIEEGDNIEIYYLGTAELDVRFKDLKFSGPGSGKLALSHGLIYAHPGIGIKASPGMYNQAKLDSLLKMRDTAYDQCMEIVNSYGNQISNTMKDLYRAQVFASVNVAMIDRIDSKKLLRLEEADYLSKGMEIRDRNDYSSIISDCPEYLDYLWRKAALKVTRNADIARGKIYSSIFKDLISSTTGIVREKAILHFLCCESRVKFSDDAEWVYDKALELMTSKKHKEFVQSVIDSRKAGAKAFDFSLTDINGSIVRLHDFRGKVVMVEVWYTGCGGCIGLANLIKSSVLPHFIGDQDVVFVTVNVSGTKEQWFAGLASGKYTNEKSVNLYTNGEKSDHPFIKYYKFQGFPQLLLIGRDGNLITSGLLRKGEVIKNSIEKALKKT